MKTFCLLASATLVSLLSSAAALGDAAFHADIQSSGQGYNGVVMLNQSAGIDQQQANAGVLSAGSQSQGQISITQTRDTIADQPLGIDASARISGDAFSQGNGVLGINQSAGIGNQHINAFRIEIGSMPESLDDSGLAQNAAPSSINSGVVAPQSGQRLVSIDDQAFAESRGVVQLTQSAGVGNRMVNNLGIRIME